MEHSDPLRIPGVTNPVESTLGLRSALSALPEHPACIEWPTVHAEGLEPNPKASANDKIPRETLAESVIGRSPGALVRWWETMRR